jgi:hypothetical protein
MTYIAGISTAFPAFIMFPVANAFARTQGYSMAVWTAIALQAISGITFTLSFGQCSLHNELTFFVV